MTVSTSEFNAAWLKAWTDKDVERLVSFYTEDAIYKDPQTAHGLKGQDQLRAYLTEMFAATPQMVYTPDETWDIENGFCGRWYCEVSEGDTKSRLRGFDLVILRGDKIAVNEVYLHDLGGAA